MTIQRVSITLLVALLVAAVFPSFSYSQATLDDVVSSLGDVEIAVDEVKGAVLVNVGFVEDQIAAIHELRVVLNYILFFGLFATGLVMFRIAALGKNQRNLW